MKTTKLLFSLILVVISTNIYAQDKLVSKKSHIKFYSHTSVEDIEANNYASVSTINKETGEVVFSVPMQSFEFEKALMQKHFNQEKFLDTKTFPKAKLKARIVNLSEIDFTTNGSYDAIVEGELTIKGVTQTIKEKGKVIVEAGQVKVESVFSIVLADYGVTFSKGKPSTNVAKEVEVTVHAEY